MTAIDRSMEFAHWSDDLRVLLRRRVCEAGGVLLIALAVTFALALATWSVQDPSLSHATDKPVRNLLGTPGAIGADMLMQLFGLACTVLVLPVAVWGWRIATHRPFDREWMRLGFWLVGAVLGAGFASCLPKTAAWPLPTGLGGVIGDALLWLPEALPGPLPEPAKIAAAAVLGVAALIAFVIATGFGYRNPNDVDDERWTRDAAASDDGDEEHTSISLGRLVHGFLSFKAWVVRLMRRRLAVRAPVRQAPIPKVSSRDRIEPPLEADDDFETDDEEEEEA